MVEKADLCKGCGICCRHPCMHKREFARIKHYLRPDAKPPIVHLDNEWIRLATRDCPFLGPTGCIVPHDDRPLVCNYYPFTFTVNRSTNTGGPIVQLDVGACPKWREWGEYWREALAYFNNMGRRHIR